MDGAGASSAQPQVLTFGKGKHGLRIHHYRPEGGRPRGLVLLVPGSRGGMGPGQKQETRGFFSPTIRSTYGALAPRLAAEHRFAVCHFTWRKPPTRAGQGRGTLKDPNTLREGVEDIGVAARFLRSLYGDDAPLVLVGFSFGGPSSMAAAKASLTGPGGRHALGPLAGVVTLGTGLRTAHGGSLVKLGKSLRGGASRSEPHDYGGLDSEACVDAYAAAGLPLLMAHGLADTTVDPRASQAIYGRAAGPKGAVWLSGTDHQMESRSDDLLGLLLEWVPALLAPRQPAVVQAAQQQQQQQQQQHCQQAQPAAAAEGDAVPAEAVVEAAAHPLQGVTGWGEPCTI